MIFFTISMGTKVSDYNYFLKNPLETCEKPYKKFLPVYLFMIFFPSFVLPIFWICRLHFSSIEIVLWVKILFYILFSTSLFIFVYVFVCFIIGIFTIIFQYNSVVLLNVFTSSFKIILLYFFLFAPIF